MTLSNHLLDSSTTLFCLIGDPVVNSPSPPMLNAAFKALAVNSIYLAFTVARENLGKALAGLRALNAVGFNITIPHKTAAMKEIDILDPVAKRTGAVNTVLNQKGKFLGFNTDVEGFAYPLRDMRVELVGKKVSLIGSGGAARACIVALGELGVGEIALLARNQEVAKQLVEEFSSGKLKITTHNLHEDESRLQCLSSDLLVNATPVGRYPSDESPVSASWIPKSKVVYDLVYKPQRTKLLRLAEQHGCKIVPGYLMLVEQAAQAFKIWSGKDAPRDLMKNVTLGLLGGIGG